MVCPLIKKGDVTNLRFRAGLIKAITPIDISRIAPQ
jgi:hypothetical protein